eukprot:363700-Chlamydomonas_euryale.AAC.7
MALRGGSCCYLEGEEWVVAHAWGLWAGSCCYLEGGGVPRGGVACMGFERRGDLAGSVLGWTAADAEGKEPA